MKFNFVSFENAKELVLRIKTLITSHTSNSTLHTTSAEKAKWNAVTNSYAGSSSPGGAANSATKLATARKIGNASFDGTANITLSQIGAAPISQVNQLQDAVDHITASHSIDGGDLMDTGPAENTYDGGTL